MMTELKHHNPRGEPAAIVVTVRGPVGSGKSTLIRAILSLLEDEDNDAAVLFNGINGAKQVVFEERLP